MVKLSMKLCLKLRKTFFGILENGATNMLTFKPEQDCFKLRFCLVELEVCAHCATLESTFLTTMTLPSYMI